MQRGLGHTKKFSKGDLTNKSSSEKSQNNIFSVHLGKDFVANPGYALNFMKFSGIAEKSFIFF